MARSAARTDRGFRGKETGPAGPAEEEDKRGKLSDAFVAAVLADFQTYGKAAIETMRTDKPDLYFKLVAAILPKEVGGEGNSQSEVRRIVVTRRIVRAKN